MITQYRSDALRRALKGLHENTPGVRASVIANVDGLLVMSYPPDRDNVHDPAGSESMAAMSSVLLSLSERTLERLAQGQLERVLVQGAGGVIVVVPAAEDAALAVLLEGEAKLGVSLYAIRRSAAELRQILAR